MPAITMDDNKYYENKIYLPLVIKVLERDLELIMKLPFKLHRPYIALMEKTIEYVRKDIKNTDFYLVRNNMKVILEKVTEKHSEYVFIHMGHEERKQYFNLDLKNETEKRMIAYLNK